MTHRHHPHEHDEHELASLSVINQKIETLVVDLRRVEREVREIREAQAQGQKKGIERVWAFTTQLALPIALLLGACVISLRDRVQHIESTRFTSTDFQKAISDLTIQVLGGPDWLRDAVSKLQATQDLTRGDVGKLTERVIRLETAGETRK